MLYDDPFFTVKDDIENNVTTALTLFNSWNRIYSTVSSRNNEELKRTEEELKSTLQDITTDLDDVEETIRVVESNPDKFSLTKREIESRREFVEQTRQRLQEMRLTLETPPKQLNSTGKNHQELIDGYKSSKVFEQVRSKSRYEEVIEMDNTKFIENESQQQSILIREQDDQLETLYGTAKNIHEIATTVGTELEDQNMLLNEFGEHVDRTQGRLERAMKKVAYIIKHNEESKSNCCIGILIVVLIILLILVIAV
ncbi:t-SNARE [Glomus cerebriforme]|uniref:t-SNARE n=1 Tax=Glomus cerebriforme TaxID=658196 RepID=A0A397THR3_9GLOM|nr:t-SNARE [Glomus cerebriforme]